MPESGSVRIAMWSGPRNVSTAMLRSWGNRSDTWVSDEPLYAHYLKATGIDHPGAREVIDVHECDWRAVVRELTGPVPEDRPIFYQKQMTHHLLPEIDRDWLDDLINCFLIRNPSEMLTSLVHQIPRPQLADTGLPQQVEIFEFVRERTGRVPPVIDSRDLLTDPETILRKLCTAVGVPFEREMLAWPPGRRETDGVWARHWYHNVERSTGFAPYRPKTDPVPEELQKLCRECVELYDIMVPHRIRADGD